MPDVPALSVVLGALEGVDVLETTLLHLTRQTIAPEVELLVVTPAPVEPASLPADLSRLGSVRVVVDPTAASVAQANAAGTRAASAPLVAFAEDHAFPEPAWAEELVRAHTRERVAAVGPAVRNANPETICSWVDFALGYVHWMEPCPEGPAPFLPGHNSCYRRDVLLARGDALDAELESETVLFLRLAAAGERLLVAPGAVVSHVNFSRWGSKLRATYHAGRVFAAARATGWSRSRRVLMAAAAPAIPLVRLVRTVRLLARPGRQEVVPWRMLPGLVLALLVDGAGQLVGYLRGDGGSGERLALFEFRRVDHVTSGDRERLDALTRGLRRA